jgi:hypothetical protein
LEILKILAARTRNEPGFDRMNRIDRIFDGNRWPGGRSRTEKSNNSQILLRVTALMGLHILSVWRGNWKRSPNFTDWHEKMPFLLGNSRILPVPGRNEVGSGVFSHRWVSDRPGDKRQHQPLHVPIYRAPKMHA